MHYRIDAFLTRFRIILLLLFGVMLACVSVGNAQLKFSSSTQRSRESADNRLSIGAFTAVSGTTVLMAPIANEGDKSFSKTDVYGNRNYLFFDTMTETSHHLIPVNENVIDSVKGFPEITENNRHTQQVEWFLYDVRSDSDGDGEITYKDHSKLAVSDAAGHGYKELITDVKKLLGQSYPEKDTLFVFYESGSKALVSKIVLPLRRVVSTKRLPLQADDVTTRRTGSRR
ncbi:MAG: hypothetical protein WEB58_12415 [Planctomycetaceae bacterium]